MGLLGATPVQAFAAGAALCSTSLGTTFTILSTSGLEKSRLGVILSSAAMLDDVAGLVMVQVISNLGGSADSFSAVTVIRPVFVSIAFAVVVPAFCWAVVKPIRRQWQRRTSRRCVVGFVHLSRPPQPTH
jgi:Kef-type K+ transport system membrane component KefB